MKRKKDRSGKIALIASLVVIFLIGVCVFSLYSISEPGFLKSLGLFSGNSEGTETGKLLTRDDETQEAQETQDDGLVVTGIVQEDDSYAAPAEWEVDGAQAVVVMRQMEASDDEVKDASTDDKKDASAEDAKDVSAEEQKETPAEEKKTDETDAAKGVQDVSGTSLNETVQDVFSDSSQVQDTALMAVDDSIDDTYVSSDYDVASSAPVHEVVRDYDAAPAEDDGGWRFDYDTEEWYHVDPEYQETPVQPVVYYGSTQEDNGEWRFNEETEEWYFASFDDLDEDDADTDDDTDADDDLKETGEWLFNESTGEWYYVLSSDDGGTKRRSDVVEDDTDDDDDQKETGEWLFDDATGEWYYVESAGAAGGEEEEDQDDDSVDEKSTGAWLYNEETGEWYYDESATVGEDGEDEDEDTDAEDEDTDESWDLDDDEDDDKDEILEGEWVYDEETHEWIYVEGSAEKEKKEDDDEDAEDEVKVEAAEEVAEEMSLGEEIVDYAMGYVGVTPYVGAGTSLTSGTDCSGFVNLIYDKYGVYCSKASMAYDGSEFGTRVGLDELEVGDIVVYGGGAHVAIYAGDGYVVHCSSPENGTVYWKMDYRSDASWGLRVLE